MVFELPVTEEKVKPHQITTLHLVCALAFIGTGAIIAVYNYTIPGWGVLLLFLGIGILCFSIFKNQWVVSPKINKVFRIVELFISFTLAFYSFLQQWKFPLGIFSMLCTVLLFALFYEKTTGKTLFVCIDSENIKLPITSRKRILEWFEVEQVLLRFGTLSINCTDDSFFQWNIGNILVDEKVLESFCSQKVEENKKKRIEDW